MAPFTRGKKCSTKLKMTSSLVSNEDPKSSLSIPHYARVDHVVGRSEWDSNVLHKNVNLNSDICTKPLKRGRGRPRKNKVVDKSTPSASVATTSVCYDHNNNQRNDEKTNCKSPLSDATKMSLCRKFNITESTVSLTLCKMVDGQWILSHPLVSQKLHQVPVARSETLEANQKKALDTHPQRRKSSTALNKKPILKTEKHLDTPDPVRTLLNLQKRRISCKFGRDVSSRGKLLPKINTSIATDNDKDSVERLADRLDINLKRRSPIPHNELKVPYKIPRKSVSGAMETPYNVPCKAFITHTPLETSLLSTSVFSRLPNHCAQSPIAFDADHSNHVLPQSNNDAQESNLVAQHSKLLLQYINYLEHQIDHASPSNFLVPQHTYNFPQCTNHVADHLKCVAEHTKAVNKNCNQVAGHFPIKELISNPVIQNATYVARPSSPSENVFAFFGRPCFRYLRGICTNESCGYVHALPDPETVSVKLKSMPSVFVEKAYVRFVALYKLAFETYFVIFCQWFGENKRCEKLVAMLHDCDRYSPPYVNFYRHVAAGLNKSGLTTTDAARTVLTNLAHLTPAAINELMDIIVPVSVLQFCDVLNVFCDIPNFTFDPAHINAMIDIATKSSDPNLLRFLIKAITSNPSIYHSLSHDHRSRFLVLMKESTR